MRNDERLTFTVDEAAKVLGFSKAVLYEAVRTKQLPTIRLGRRIMIPKHALMEFIGAPASIVALRTRLYEDGVADERSRIADLLVRLLAEVRGS